EELLLPTRIEFFRDGALFKVMTIGQTIQQDGFTLPTEIRMETVAAGSVTTISQAGCELDTEIPDDVCTEPLLRRRGGWEGRRGFPRGDHRIAAHARPHGARSCLPRPRSRLVGPHGVGPGVVRPGRRSEHPPRCRR